MALPLARSSGLFSTHVIVDTIWRQPTARHLRGFWNVFCIIALTFESRLQPPALCQLLLSRQLSFRASRRVLLHRPMFSPDTAPKPVVLHLRFDLGALYTVLSTVPYICRSIYTRYGRTQKEFFYCGHVCGQRHARMHPGSLARATNRARVQQRRFIWRAWSGPMRGVPVCDANLYRTFETPSQTTTVL